MWRLLLFVMVVALTIWAAARISRNMGSSFVGSAEDTYYHGSSTKIAGDYLEPRPSKVLNGEAAVFATNNLSTAILSIPRWTGADFDYGTYNGVHYVMELYPGAFEKLRAPGWLYYVSSSPFKSDSRLGMVEHEFISHEMVKILHREYIPNALEKLQEIGDIVFISYDELLESAVGKYVGKKSKSYGTSAATAPA